VAILVGLTIAVLVGFAGLALDGGRLYLTKTELQNAADACALAGAYELVATPSIAQASFEQAENAALTIAARNRVGFQAAAIDTQDVTVEFGTALSGGSWLPAASNPSGDSRYIRCTIEETGITPWFMQVVGMGDQTVRAAATATLEHAQTACAIPLGMCRQGPAPSFGLVKGQWYDGKFDSGGGATGSFNWIDFSPPAGGASELGALLRGNGACELNITHPVGEPGNMGNAAAMAWNTRFGLYGGSDNVNNAPPDYSGYSYTSKNWPSRSDAIDDFLARRTTGSNYGANVQAGNTLTGLSVNNSYNPVTSTTAHRQFGANRRLAVAPIVNCASWGTSQTVPIEAWACVLMLHPISHPSDTVYMEYEGRADDPSSPCSTSGVVGGAGSAGPLVPGLVQ
jgi:hypothetical protein